MTVPVVVVGGGVHGVHVAVRLVRDGVVAADELIIIDPDPHPLASWRRRAISCRMPFLRSPASHGIDPDLRSIERLRAERRDGESHWAPPYHRPSVGLFAAHVGEIAGRYLAAARVCEGTVAHISPNRVGADAESTLVVETDGGTTICARHVVLAPGQPPPAMPAALQLLPERYRRGDAAAVFHVHESIVDESRLGPGNRVAVIGGGIAAGHLVRHAAGRGATVDWWVREHPGRWQFDADPCFIGRRCGHRFESISTRAAKRGAIRRARRPGSMPPDLWDAVVSARIDRSISQIDDEIALAAGHGRDAVTLVGARHAVARTYDTVIAATGFENEVPAAALIASCSRNLGLPVDADGFPVIRADLSWGDALFVTGGLAEMILGPPARNIIGAHLAARIISPALASRQPQAAGRR